MFFLIVGLPIRQKGVKASFYWLPFVVVGYARPEASELAVVFVPVLGTHGSALSMLGIAGVLAALVVFCITYSLNSKNQESLRVKQALP